MHSIVLNAILHSWKTAGFKIEHATQKIPLEQHANAANVVFLSPGDCQREKFVHSWRVSVSQTQIMRRNKLIDNCFYGLGKLFGACMAGVGISAKKVKRR